MFIRTQVFLFGGMSIFSACAQNAEGTVEPGRTVAPVEDVAVAPSAEASPPPAAPESSMSPSDDRVDPATAEAQRIERYERGRAAFEREPVDNKWGAALAVEITNRFRAALEGPDLVGVSVKDAECRYQTCVVEVHSPDQGGLGRLRRVSNDIRFNVKSPDGDSPSASLASRPDPAGGVLGRFSFLFSRPQ